MDLDKDHLGSFRAPQIMMEVTGIVSSPDSGLGHGQDYEHGGKRGTILFLPGKEKV